MAANFAKLPELVRRGGQVGECPRQPRQLAASLLNDEPFRRRHRTDAEIVMPGAGNTHKALGRVDKAVQPFAERHGDDCVVLAMHHQNRRRDLARAQIRAELVLHKEPHRHKPVVLRADIGRRGERGLEHKVADRFLRCNRECQGGAERFAP